MIYFNVLVDDTICKYIILNYNLKTERDPCQFIDNSMVSIRDNIHEPEMMSKNAALENQGGCFVHIDHSSAPAYIYNL